MQAKWWVQFSVQGFLLLTGVGVQAMPVVETWTPSIVIWSIALVWASITLVLWRRSLTQRIPTSDNGLMVSNEMQDRRQNITALREAIVSLKRRIDSIRDDVKELPLSYYDEHYLSHIESYSEFLTNYPNKLDGQYVAIGMYYGVGCNPEFDMRMSKEAELQDKVEMLKQSVPDTIVQAAVDALISTKKNQAVMTIDHKINPENAKATTSWLMGKRDAEDAIENGVREFEKRLNRRLLELWKGAKYE